MIIGTGIDVIEIERVQRACRSDAFRTRVFTEAERDYAESRGSRPEVYAGMFAAKEAVAKAFGTGVDGFSLLDVEILHGERNAPYVRLHAYAADVMTRTGARRAHVSISHDRTNAVAMAILED